MLSFPFSSRFTGDGGESFLSFTQYFRLDTLSLGLYEWVLHICMVVIALAFLDTLYVGYCFFANQFFFMFLLQFLRSCFHFLRFMQLFVTRAPRLLMQAWL